MENEEIVKAVQQGENVQANMQELYIKNEGFIYYFATKYSNIADIQDLMQEAYFALDNAVRTYDGERGAKFTTHFAFHLKNVFTRYINKCYGVSLSERDVMLIAKYNSVNGESLPDDVVCAELRIDDNQLQTLKEMRRNVCCASLDECDAETNICLLDNIPSEENIEEECIDALSEAQAARELWETVDNLEERQAELIKLRYGDNKTRVETAAELGLTIEQERKCEEKAMKNLRWKAKKLRELMEIYDNLNYRNTGLAAFKSRQMSNVEYVTMLKMNINEEKPG